MSDESSGATHQPSLLVADDDDDILSFLVPELKSEGYRVHVVHNGVEALRLLLRQQPDLAILDVGMPGLDGTAVARILQTKGVDAPPIMFLSARAMPAERALGLSTGAIDYMTKPFEMSELLTRIRNALRKGA